MSEEIVAAKRTFDSLIRFGHKADRPEERGSFQALCPDWRWDAIYASQYNSVLLWMLGMPSKCLGSAVLPDRGLWMAGNMGTGKSTLMRGVKNFCTLFADPRSPNMPRPMRWMHAKDIVAEYEQTGPRILDELCEVETLIIDDLGTEDLEAKRYGSVKNVVEEVLSRRYDRRRLTMVTTNLTMEEVKRDYRERIYDRVRETFNILEFTGPTHRKKFNPGI